MSDPIRVPLSEPFITGNARRYLQECLDTNFVSSVGPFVERFEQEFAGFVGSRYAVACASGTAALHVAMRLLGLEQGDDLVTATLTFVASANPALYERARVVLVDSERETWNLDPALVAEELDRRARLGLRQPRIVEAVHILGHPARLEPIVEACQRHGVALLEDASEALGARWVGGAFDGRHVGTVGRMGCFSFNGNKIITTGGGGMIVTDDERLARRAKHLTTQARLPGPEYRHDEVGYNYRLTNLAAALGLSQMESLDSFIARKAEIASGYDAAFAELPSITRPPRSPWARSTTWLYSILVEKRDAVFAHLAKSGIQSRPIWSPLHTMPMYRDAQRLGGGVAESLFERALSLPSSIGLSGADQRDVIEAVRQGVTST